jgi:hypothetical protein
MENENAQPTLINHGLKHAVILGVISIALLLIVYVIDYTLLVTFKYLGVSLLIYLGYGIYSGINYRNETGGYLSFGKAFQHGFIVFAASALLSTLFSLVLYNVVDAELPTKLTDAAVANAEEMMISFGMPAEQMDEALAKTRTDTEERFTVVGIAKGYIWTLAFCAIFALISGAIAKKKQPEMV